MVLHARQVAARRPSGRRIAAAAAFYATIKTAADKGEVRRPFAASTAGLDPRVHLFARR
jgi:hypothetical protein